MTNTPKPAAGCVNNGQFLFPVRIYYEDTDAGGIVYYANYLKFTERARSEFLRFLGIEQRQHLADSGCGFVVRSCNIEYLSSAMLDDELTVSCQVEKLGAAFAIIHQEIRRADELLCTADVKVVYMNIHSKRPTRIPAEFIDKFGEFLQ